jgi:PPOX class probable F420-dependent enzyme
VPAIADPARLRELVAAAPVARLATLRADGTPRLVPITFALVGERICSVVDAVKPKRTSRLARLADVARDPRVGLVVDHYAADWSQLWWVRVDGTAAVTDPDERALDALAAKYPPYRDPRPAGPLLVITPARWSGWAAS